MFDTRRGISGAQHVAVPATAIALVIRLERVPEWPINAGLAQKVVGVPVRPLPGWLVPALLNYGLDRLVG